MFAPYMPFITEALYGQLYKEKMGTTSLHLTGYTTATQSYPQSLVVSDLLIAIVGEVRRFKTEKQLSLKVPLAALTLHSVDQNLLKTLAPLDQLLKGVTHAEIITYTSGDIDSPQLTQKDGKWFAELDLDDIIKTEKPV
jgi:valyl-tRNA synthetase